MRIITPQNAAFSPSGPGDSGVSNQYNVTQTITADVAVGPVSIGSAPESGPYLLAVYIEVVSTSAATGTLTLNLNYDGGSVLSDAHNVFAIGATMNNVFDTIVTLPVTVDWAVTGFTAGTASVKLIASLTKLF